ncbi:MAG: TIR domain-containing protein [Magnetococcales bacterium]|nr:TIR domain-containing protein [Magnetococcales bacterium]
MKHKELLLEHLESLEGKVTAWHDGMIEAGVEWELPIRQALARCNVAVLLVSRSFLNSDYVKRIELPLLQERQRSGAIHLLPVVVGPCGWKKSRLGEFNVLDFKGKAINEMTEPEADRAWLEVVDQLEAWADAGPAITVGSDKPDLAHLPRPSAKLVGRGEELKSLKKWFADPGVAVVGIVAAGGTGKSALSVAWLEEMGGVGKVFGWSFYSQGQHVTQTNSDAFFREAFRYFGHAGAIPQSGEGKAQALADLLARQPYLLILDGVEPLQYPPDVREGQFQDSGLYRLMRHLEANRPRSEKSLVLVSSRWGWPGLETATNHQRIDLGPLSDEDGVALLRSLGVTKGLQRDFVQAVQEMKNHALALVLLGKLLAREQEGDVSRRDCVKEGLFKDEHAKRVMAYYDTEVWEKESPQRAFLQLLGLFDRPMTRESFAELEKKADLAKPLRGIGRSDFNAMIFDLEATGLLQKEHDQWDAHPLVREYFGQTLEKNHPDLFRQAHWVLFEFFSAVKPHRPDTLEGLEPLYRAVHHGCKAGEYQKAMDEVLQERIYRGAEFFSTKKLGAISADLAALAGFFDPSWERVVKTDQLSDANRGWLLGLASYYLMALGRMADAVAPHRACMEMFEKLQDWKNAANSAGSLVDLLIPIGELDEALEVAERGIGWADRSGEWQRQVAGRARLAHAWHRQWALEKSAQVFQEAEKIQKQHQSYNLYGVAGFRYCALLLEQAQDKDLDAACKRGKEAQAITKQEQWLLDIALDHLTQACALTGMERDEEAGSHFDQAVIGIKKAGNIRFTPEILIHRAAFLRKKGELKKAWLDLEEALEICVWSGMRLWEAEARLEEVHLLLDEKRREAAGEALKKAGELIEKMPYPLRYGALQEARKRFGQAS